MANRIWLELEVAGDDSVNETRAALATHMLEKLGDTGGRKFEWSKSARSYTFGGDMGVVVLRSNGEWFNLDYLGRD